jgi:aldehyde:ferredoxin oxidoreductase
MRGYTGKILNVDLSRGSIEEELIDDAVYARFLSGVGLAAHLLYDRIPENADPLGPDNILGLVAGALAGTGSYFSGRWLAVGKSPLTGTWGDANAGGTFAPAIKRCGYDGIFFYGVSPKPVYLQIDIDGARLEDASDLWGLDAIEAEEALLNRANCKRQPAAAVIGQSGENLSLISGISNDKGRIAARSGLGAVMGSKKVKGVLLAGSRPVRVNDPERLKVVKQEHDKMVKSAAKMPIPGWAFRMLGTMAGKAKTVSPGDGIMTFSVFSKWGTGATNQMGIEMGDSPIKNWSGSNLDFDKKKSKLYNPDNIKKNETRKYHCDSCPVGCGGHYKTKDKFEQTHKPEYETVNQFGALLLNEDLDALVFMNELCNRAGMDTISAGGTIAFAIECFERGVLTTDDTGGLELTWGNSKAIVALLEKMIGREGIGDILADGSRVAAEKIGKGSHAWAIHAGGQELAAHDPRLDPGFGLHYSVEPTPGRHTSGSQLYYDQWRIWEQIPSFPNPGKKYPVEEKYETAGKGMRGVGCSIFKMLADASGICLFALMPGLTRFPIHDFLNAVTGFEKTVDEYFEIGRRIQTLRQMFNIKQGIDPKSLAAHPRSSGQPPLVDGVLQGRSFDLAEMIQDYWKMMGWDPETGIPNEETLASLELPILSSKPVSRS